jgi:hypothetical protein
MLRLSLDESSAAVSTIDKKYMSGIREKHCAELVLNWESN